MTILKRLFAICMIAAIISTCCYPVYAADFTEVNVGGNTVVVNWIPVKYDVDDNIIVNNTKRKIVEVTVSYNDNYSGYFWLSYKDLDGVQQSTDSVFSKGTGAAAHHTFTLYDAGMNNGGIYNTSSGDFSITYRNVAGTTVKPSDFDSFTAEEQAKYDSLSVNSVDVKVYEKYALDFKASTENVGNIFFDGDTKSFNVSFANPGTAVVNTDVRYEVLDYNKTQVIGESQTRNYRIAGGKNITDSVMLTLSKYGVYFLHVSIQDETGKTGGEWYVPFSISPVSDTVNYDLGINAHINAGYEEEFAKGLEALKRAGFGRLRHGYSWNEYYENENEVPELSQNVIDKAYELGYKITLGFRGNNDYLYGTTDKNGKVVEGSAPYIPKVTEQINGFTDYVYQSLGAIGSKIDTVEIWNEPDMAMYKYNNNKTENDPEYEYGPVVYANLMKAVYQKVKPDFPAVEIGGVGACEVDGGWYDNQWTLPVLKADLDSDWLNAPDGYKYLDKVVVHHYSKGWNDGADCHDTMNALQTLEKNIKNINIFSNINLKFHHTEFGISSTYSVGKEKQASRLSQYLLSLRAYRPDEEYFIYNFTNDGELDFAPFTSEANFGITESSYYDVPYAAKPAFIAVANMNSLIGGLDNVEILSEDNEHVYAYSNSDASKTVYAIYLPEDVSGAYDLTSIVAEHVTRPVDVYVDMYGNPVDISSGDTALSSEVIYAVCNADYKAPENNNTFADYTRKTVTYTEGENGIVYVDAYFPDMNDNDPLATKVFDENGELVQVNQLVQNGDGLYSFAYRETENGPYSVWFGGKSFSGVYITGRNAETGAFIFAESENERQLTDFEQWDSAENIKVYVQLDTKLHPECSIFCAGYAGDRLVAADNFGIGDMNYDAIYDRYCTEIDKAQFEGADQIRVFVFKSNNTLIPLTKKLELNKQN